MISQYGYNIITISLIISLYTIIVFILIRTPDDNSINIIRNKLEDVTNKNPDNYIVINLIYSQFDKNGYYKLLYTNNIEYSIPVSGELYSISILPYNGVSLYINNIEITDMNNIILNINDKIKFKMEIDPMIGTYSERNVQIVILK